MKPAIKCQLIRKLHSTYFTLSYYFQDPVSFFSKNRICRYVVLETRGDCQIKMVDQQCTHASLTPTYPYVSKYLYLEEIAMHSFVVFETKGL